MDKTIRYKSSFRWHGKNSILIPLGILLLIFWYPAQSQIKIIFVGDIMLSRNVGQEIQFRRTSPWEDLKNQFHSANLVIGNLEGAVERKNTDRVEDTYVPVFGIDSSRIGLLRDAGFNALTVENNHSLDLANEGKERTLSTLINNNLRPICFDNSPQFFTINDTVISVVALNVVLCRDSSKNQIPSIEIKQKLRLAKSLSTLVIVSIHWGSELMDWPNREQFEIARWLIKNGADVIIGSHPHVIQKPELIDGKPVFFSLGNHLFDQKYAETKEGLMVELSIRNGILNYNGFITRTKPNSFYPEITGKMDLGFNPTPLKNSDLKINGFNIRPLSLADSKENRIGLQGYKKNMLVWQTPPMSIVTIETGRMDGKNDFLFTLEKHYSSIDHENNVRPYVYQVDNRGIFARWRGSALAWPILDALLLPEDNSILCVLHRGDSFIDLDRTNKTKRIAVYKWNGFGFGGQNDSIKFKTIEKMFEE